MGVRKNFFIDVAYSGLSKYSTLIVALVVSAILSRILSPGDFGVVAIATVFISFFNLLSDFGIATAIVQFKDLSQYDIRNIFGWTFWLAVLLSFAFFICSPFIASFYDNLLLRPVCGWLCLQIFFATLNIVPNALLLKGKKFNIIAARTFIIHAFCGAIAVIGAYKGMGVYALLINPIIGTFLTFIINTVYMKVSIRFFPQWISLKKIFSFSIFQFLFNFINYIGNNVDKMIIGKAISITGLGYYDKAYRLGQMPTQTVNGVIGPVLHPYLSDYQDRPQKLLEVYDKMNRLLLSLSFPISAFCLLCSKELVLIIFGQQWIESVKFFAIISVTITTQLASSPTGAFLQASNNTKFLFFLGTINVIVALTGLFIGAFIFRSIAAICICCVVSSFISFANAYFVIYSICFKQSPWPIFRYSIRPLMFFIFVGVIGYWLIPDINGVHLVVSLLIKAALWFVSVIVFWQLFTPFKPREYFNVLMSKINKVK